MSNQFDAIAAIRARAINATGWNSTWPVAYAQQPFTPPAIRQFVEEEIVGGPGIPVAITPPSYVFYRYSGQWQLLFTAPPMNGAAATLAMAEAVVQEVMRSGLELPDGTPILVRSVDIGNDVPVDGDVQRALVIAYEYTIPVSTAPRTPQTPAEIVQFINALDKGVMDGLYIKGINQTYGADVVSPTGFYCTAWADAADPNNGKVWTGLAPCLADGELVGEGLEMPASAGLGTVVADTTVPSLAPGSSVCYDGQFADYKKGRTFGLVSKLTDAVPYLMIGEVGTGYLYSGFDQFRYYGIGDQPGAQVPANQLAVHSLVNLKWTDSTGQIAISPGTVRTINVSRLSRDLIHFTVPDTVANSGIPDLTANGAQRLRLLPSSLGGGATMNATTAGVSCVYFVQGRLDGAGTKLLHDFVEAQSWGAGAWNDPLANWVGLVGDSYYDVIQGEHIRVGRVAGAPVLTNTRIIPGSSARGSGYSFGGRGVVDYTYPMLGWTARDMDTSRRAGIYVWPGGEFNNAGNSASTLAANKFVGKTLKSISPKNRVIQRESELGNNDPLTSPAAPMNADLEATFPTGGYADLLEKQWYLTPWNTYNYADSAPDKVPVLWKPFSLDGSQHPSDLHQVLIIEYHRLPILSLLGTDISNLTGYVKPTADHLDLTVGGGTGSTTWTPQTFALTPATGKTVSFAIGTMQNVSGLWAFVAGTSVATVNASTGVVTPVASGQAALVCMTDDGAIGVCVVNVSGGTGPTDGSPEDVVAAMTTAGLTLDSFWDLQRGVTLSGSNIASVDDARGAGAGPQLTPQNATAIPYDAVNKLATIDGGAELGTALNALYDPSASGRFLFFLGTIETSGFGAVGLKTASDTWSLSDGSGQWSLATTFSTQPKSGVAATGTTPFLAILESNADTPSNVSFDAVRALNELLLAVNSGMPAGNARVSIGNARVKIRGLGIGRGGSVPAAAVASLDRWRTARGGSATVDGTKGLLVLSNTNASGAGTTTPATDAWYTKLVAQLPAAYKGRNYNFLDRLDRAAAMAPYLATRQIDLGVRTPFWVWIETGLFDPFTSTLNAAQTVTAIQNLCTALKAVGVHVRVGVSTIYDNSTLTEAGGGFYATVNTAIRALVGQGKADAVLDYQAHGWSAAALGDGTNFNTATSTLIANAILALMTAVEL